MLASQCLISEARYFSVRSLMRALDYFRFHNKYSIVCEAFCALSKRRQALYTRSCFLNVMFSR